MAKGGKKYPLLLYQHMLNRWWPVTLLLALSILGSVGLLWGAQWYFDNPKDNPFPLLSDFDGTMMLVAGIFALLFTFFLLFARNMAYVQLFADHIKLATPFMRLNISYKRILRSTTSQVAVLFPPKSISEYRREIIEPISGNTAIIIHLKNYPVSRNSMKLFLSPFFFYDDTPHFVLVVDDWMKFSSELESRRTSSISGKMPEKAPLPPPARKRVSSGLLDDLKKK
jgi:hypothetical protein